VAGARVGLTNHAQRSLGDIVFVELPKAGQKLETGQSFGTVESVKAVSEVYAPVGGRVAAVNQEIDQSPEEINEDAYNAWLIELDMTSPQDVDSLMTAEEYEACIAEETQ
jgi:glycine cleavage system H protein